MKELKGGKGLGCTEIQGIGKIGMRARADRRKRLCRSGNGQDRMGASNVAEMLGRNMGVTGKRNRDNKNICRITND